MPRLRSGPLAAWTSAWWRGQVGPDQVVDAVTRSDAAHLVDGLALGPVTLLDLLTAWRRSESPVRVGLPVPGDIRGLPGPLPFRAAALERGEAVFGGGLGAVPFVVDHSPSSAPTTVRWQVFAVDDPPADHQQVDEVQYELITAIRETATALAAADVAGGSADPDAVAAARRAGERLNLPPGHPSAAVALLAQAERMQAVLDLALGDPLGGAVDRAGVIARAESLRPLVTAVRRARLAAYNAGWATT